MWPVIFSIGEFELRTLSIFTFLAFFMGAYVFWKRGREEHYSEMQLMDGLISSILYGFVIGRIAFIFFNLEDIGISIVNWVDIFGKPGVNALVMNVSAGMYLYRFALKKRWDVFEVLDFGVLAFALSQVIFWFGLFLDGSGFGLRTDLPVGVIFPSVFEKHHPVQFYYTLFYFLLYIYLARAEYRYRTFAWYRYGKKTAQTGFLTSMFFIFSGLFTILVSFVSVPDLVIAGIRFDIVLGVLAFIFGVILLGIRSGRLSTKLFGRRSKKVLESLKV